MSEEDRLKRFKDYLTLCILIMYISTSMIDYIHPNVSRKLILDLDKLEKIYELTE